MIWKLSSFRVITFIRQLKVTLNHLSVSHRFLRTFNGLNILNPGVPPCLGGVNLSQVKWLSQSILILRFASWARIANDWFIRWRAIFSLSYSHYLTMELLFGNRALTLLRVLGICFLVLDRVSWSLLDRHRDRILMGF